MSDRKPQSKKVLKERLGVAPVAEAGKPQGTLAATPVDLQADHVPRLGVAVRG